MSCSLLNLREDHGRSHPFRMLADPGDRLLPDPQLFIQPAGWSPEYVYLLETQLKMVSGRNC